MSPRRSRILASMNSDKEGIAYDIYVAIITNRCAIFQESTTIHHHRNTSGDPVLRAHQPLVLGGYVASGDGRIGGRGCDVRQSHAGCVCLVNSFECDDQYLWLS